MVDTRTFFSPEALFRYHIVSLVTALQHQGWRRSDAVRQVAEPLHYTDTGQARRVGERTLWTWLAAFHKGGVEALEPKKRPKIASSTVLSQGMLDFLISERGLDLYASVPELIDRARAHNIIGPEERVDRTSVWRAMGRLGLSTKPGAPPNGADMRRFEHIARMHCVLVDGKHFRAGLTRRKRVAFYYLDDATRYGLGVVVTTAENAQSVLFGLYEVLARYGLMSLLYWDHGPGFIADAIKQVAARLDLAAVYGRVAYKEGRGKVERFNRSAKARVLRNLAGADVDTDCGALTLLLQHDLFEVYNHRRHTSLGDDTPYERWHTSEHPLRPALSDSWLKECFTLPVKRLVSKDHIVSVDGTEYEVPRGLAGTKPTLHRRLLEPTEHGHALYLLHQDELQRLHPVDKHANATSGRARDTTPEPTPEGAPPKSASHLSFEAALPPMTNADGGYPDTNTTDQEEK
jgi:transposase InsO family protein